MSDDIRRAIAQHASNQRWARLDADARRAATQTSRAAAWRRWCQAARDEGITDPDQVEARARELRHQHLRKMGQKSAANRRAAAERRRADAKVDTLVKILAEAAPTLTSEQRDLLAAALGVEK